MEAAQKLYLVDEDGEINTSRWKKAPFGDVCMDLVKHIVRENFSSEI